MFVSCKFLTLLTLIRNKANTDPLMQESFALPPPQTASSIRKVPEYTVYPSFFMYGLGRHKLVRMSMLTPVHCRNSQQREHQKWSEEQ